MPELIIREKQVQPRGAHYPLPTAMISVMLSNGKNETLLQSFPDREGLVGANIDQLRIQATEYATRVAGVLGCKISQ
jgi:hypothetical protein